MCIINEQLMFFKLSQQLFVGGLLISVFMQDEKSVAWKLIRHSDNIGNEICEWVFSLSACLFNWKDSWDEWFYLLLELICYSKNMLQ